MINILVCLNKNLYRYLFVLLISIYKNNAPENICLYVFETDFNNEEKKFLNNYVKALKSNIYIYHIDHDLLSDFTANGRITIEAYLRLLTVELLPNDLERVLYIDVDTIVDKSLKELYNTEFDDKYLCVCPTPLCRISYEEFVKTEDKAKNCYFNSGVILFNLKRLREHGYDLKMFKSSYNEILKICQKSDPDLKRPYFEDQGVLNYMFGTKAKYISGYYYNYRPCYYLIKDDKSLVDLMKNDNRFATIIHYTNDGCKKPWSYYFECIEEAVFSVRNSPDFNSFIYYLQKKWWDYAIFTPFYREMLDEAIIRTKEYKRLLPSLLNEKKNADRNKFYKYSFFFYKLCTRYINDNSYIQNWFLNKGISRIAIYGRSMISDKIIELLNGSDVEIVYIIEDNCKLKIPSYPRSISDLPMESVDALLICDLINCKKIISKWQDKAAIPIISAEDLLK